MFGQIISQGMLFRMYPLTRLCQPRAWYYVSLHLVAVFILISTTRRGAVWRGLHSSPGRARRADAVTRRARGQRRCAANASQPVSQPDSKPATRSARPTPKPQPASHARCHARCHVSRRDMPRDRRYICQVRQAETGVSWAGPLGRSCL